MEKIKIKTDYITLGQFLKLVNAVDSGVVAKLVIQDGLVKVNDEIETRRGKKLYSGDQITFEDTTYIIE